MEELCSNVVVDEQYLSDAEASAMAATERCHFAADVFGCLFAEEKRQRIPAQVRALCLSPFRDDYYPSSSPNVEAPCGQCLPAGLGDR
jgi:hypothetical protein